MVKKKRNVYFVAGYTPRKELMGAIAYLEELEDTDAEHTRLYMYNLNKNYWSHRELEHEIVSLTYLKNKGNPAWYLLGKRGIVVKISPSGVSEFEINLAGTGPGCYGYLDQIREIGGELYICGMCRQVYKMVKKSWISIADEILAPDDSVEYNFKSIDGTSKNNIYAVGWKGEIFHYNGKKWSKCDSPTNIDLNAIKCVDEKNAYICGKNGMFLHGYGDSWNVIHDKDFDDNLWGLEVYQGIPYVASPSGIFKFNGSSIVSINTQLDPSPDSGHLHANDNILWSFGDKDTIFFDGKKWKRVICPDNQ